MSDSEAYLARDKQTKEKPSARTSRQEAEARLKEIDELYNTNPTQDLLNERLKVLAELMSKWP